MGEARIEAQRADKIKRTASTYIFGAICPSARQGRGARPARLQTFRDESTSCRDRPKNRRPERACGSRPSTGLAGM